MRNNKDANLNKCILIKPDKLHYFQYIIYILKINITVSLNASLFFIIM